MSVRPWLALGLLAAGCHAEPTATTATAPAPAQRWNVVLEVVPNAEGTATEIDIPSLPARARFKLAGAKGTIGIRNGNELGQHLFHLPEEADADGAIALRAKGHAYLTGFSEPESPILIEVPAR